MNNPSVMAFIMSLTAGTIFMVTVREIISEAIKHTSFNKTLLMVLVGILIMGAYFTFL